LVYTAGWIILNSSPGVAVTQFRWPWVHSLQASMGRGEVGVVESWRIHLCELQNLWRGSSLYCRSEGSFLPDTRNPDQNHAERVPRRTPKIHPVHTLDAGGRDLLPPVGGTRGWRGYHHFQRSIHLGWSLGGPQSSLYIKIITTWEELKRIPVPVEGFEDARRAGKRGKRCSPCESLWPNQSERKPLHTCTPARLTE
jgi:hypothetical protein